MTRIAFLLVTTSLTLAAACAPAAPGDPVGETAQASLTYNSLSFNSLTNNALIGNSLIGNSLIANALTSNALTSNALANNGLQDPDSRQFFSYLVSCALPADASVTVPVDGTEASFPGGLGLAPEWGEEGGRCDDACQRWVSACLLARVDYLGVHKEISLRGDHPALAVSGAERAAYTVREATYYGNVFTSPAPQRRYACLPPEQTEIPRVCGPSLDGCVVDVEASCDQVCGAARADGSFPDCRPGAGRHGQGGPTYAESITVYLRPGE